MKDRRDIIGYKYKNDEQELREQIAQEIEAYGILGEDDRRVVEMFFRLRESFAAIARGNK